MLGGSQSVCGYCREEEILFASVLNSIQIKNGVFWDIKTQFVSHRRNITSLLQSPAG
jgi:hypothetical protein